MINIRSPAWTKPVWRDFRGCIAAWFRRSTAEPSTSAHFGFIPSVRDCIQRPQVQICIFFFSHVMLVLLSQPSKLPFRFPPFCPVFIFSSLLAPRTCFFFFFSACSCANPASSVRAGRLGDWSDGIGGG